LGGEVTFLDQNQPARPEQQGDPTAEPVALQWVDQLAQEMLLTAQAFQQLQAAFTGRYITRTG
jgi:hypothetical protein